MHILEFFKFERKQQKISRKEISARLYMSESNYENIERGLVRLSLENYLAICKVLDISPTLLLKDSQSVIIDEHDLDVLIEASCIVNKIAQQRKQQNMTVSLGDNNSNIYIANGDIKHIK